jgi:hypothetical protein
MYSLPVSNDGAGINSLPVSNNLIFSHEGNHLAHIINMRLGEIMAEVRLIRAEDLENELRHMLCKTAGPAGCKTTILLPLHQTDSAPLSL